ncbi:type-1 angiotensin II receptor-like [Sinocyclocheilus rhinocerous]|uniref:type-1 angiotensin II receptor-like n=1 Tax=Sinocyclocheilus rhinocerous TaxID=307959 RepID=UPI0007B9CFF8|nr:PREDICTED: type-1 angiotensin II receptor-like [Sinocyclocheilus rhinocerous]
MLNHRESSVNSTSWTTANLVSGGLMGLCFLVGVPGNIAVIVFILHHFKKDNFTVHLMLNLAAADILCLITLPVWIYSELESIDKVTCKFFTALVYCSAYSSVITVTVLSVYRCLRIRHPQLWSRMSKRRERALLISGWSLALLFSCPGVLTQEIIQSGSKMECERILESKDSRIVALLESLLGFFLPFTIMLTSYYCLYKTATQGAFRCRHRPTKLVTRIVIVFFIFWAPHQIIKLEEICAKFLGSEPVLSLVSDIAGSLIFINSCVNPFLYAFSSRSLHKRKQPKESMVTKGSQHLQRDHSIAVNSSLVKPNTLHLTIMSSQHMQ